MSKTLCCCPIFLVVALLGIASANCQQSELLIFSNVEYNVEGGDLLGAELEFTNNGSAVTGNLRIYAGGCANPIPLAGSLSSNQLHVSGQSEDYGKVEVTGTVRGGGNLICWLRLEKGKRPERIRLKKIAKPHC
jgi:hypothetical protein